MALLSLKDVSVTYHSGGRDVHAINHVSLEIEKGESLGIVGESGSGKTTLIMAVLRLLPPGRAAVTGRRFWTAGICSRWTMRRSRPCDGRSWQSCSRRP